MNNPIPRLTLPADSQTWILLQQLRHEVTPHAGHNLFGIPQFFVEVGRDCDGAFLVNPVYFRIAASDGDIGQFRNRSLNSVTGIDPDFIKTGQRLPIRFRITHHQLDLMPSPLQSHHFFAVIRCSHGASDAFQRHAK